MISKPWPQRSAEREMLAGVSVPKQSTALCANMGTVTMLVKTEHLRCFECGDIRHKRFMQLGSSGDSTSGRALGNWSLEGMISRAVTKWRQN